jgi:MoaA/NifB/PqqE/SkfB family radical SAM enzyme
VPLVSIEGTREDTDTRRGEGMHERILSVLGELDRTGILFGVSLTVSRKNLLSILDPQVVEDLYLRGARIFIL